MTKDQATEFLRTLKADSGTGSGGRVIVVQSSRELKQLVTATLEQLEAVGASSLDGKAALPDWHSLQEQAQRAGCRIVSQALRGAELLFALLPQEPASNLLPAHLRSVNALTGLLLRTYIEGHDRRGGGELREVLASLESVSPGASSALALGSGSGDDGVLIN